VQLLCGESPARPDVLGSVHLHVGRDRELVVATASHASQWTDWKVAFTLPGPFISEPLLDAALMQSDGVLSVYLQDSPKHERKSTPIHVVDFSLSDKP
jgi:hypothetical protein